MTTWRYFRGKIALQTKERYFYRSLLEWCRSSRHYGSVVPVLVLWLHRQTRSGSLTNKVSSAGLSMPGYFSHDKDWEGSLCCDPQVPVPRNLKDRQIKLSVCACVPLLFGHVIEWLWKFLSAVAAHFYQS